VAPGGLVQGTFDVQPYGAHQGDRVAARDRTLFHAVVEVEIPSFELILEVHVDRTRRERVDDSCQREIVRGDNSQSAMCDERANDSFSTATTIVRIRAVQNFV